MEFPDSTSRVLNKIRNTSAITETKASYLASLVRLQKASNTVAGTIISDTAEISQSAMNKFLSEIKR